MHLSSHNKILITCGIVTCELFTSAKQGIHNDFHLLSPVLLHSNNLKHTNEIFLNRFSFNCQAPITYFNERERESVIEKNIFEELLFSSFGL